MIIAVTGGTGFIGRHLVRSLLSDGETLRLLVRSQPGPDWLKKLPAEKVRVDLLDPDSLKRALAGCHRLYHLAACARNWAPDDRVFYRINVEGFRNILEAALAAGLERVVYVSSSVVSGPSGSAPVTEDSSRDHIPYFTTYEASKALSEKIIPGYLNRGLEIVIGRPTRVYGPGLMSEANSVTRLIKYYLKYRFCPVLNRGQERGNYVYVEDVVAGLKLLMSSGRAGQAYFLGDENISLAGFYDLLEEVSGRRALRLRIPPSPALSLARLEGWKARKLGIYPLITESWVRTFLHNWEVSINKAQRELGYQPRGLRAGLKATCQWLGYRTKS
ncbi:MAG: NAD-dependent epimerase/dehydratase family protein [Candidatus Saccharicenans sp.]|jgi:farnesol dehydrogenase|nr:NAD-dependent epimerase/dehydratase family protein [Candidatus Saccharicenans sp.]MDH7574556.1 NAD-dependent epimerase/dehydratase family protein [Candidatus Saccharicenans sp.]